MTTAAPPTRAPAPAPTRTPVPPMPARRQTTAPSSSTSAAGPAVRLSTPQRPSGAAKPVAPTAAPRVPGGNALQATEAQAPKISAPGAGKSSKFRAVMDKLKRTAGRMMSHKPAAVKAAEAQAASQPPANEKLAGAQAKQVDSMKGAEGKKPEASSFLALLRGEIEKVMPKTLGDTDSFMDGGQQQQLKGAMTGNVNQQKEEATGSIKQAATQQPDESQVQGKEVQPLPTETPPAPPPIGGANAVPDTKPPEEVSLQANKDQANQEMSNADVTPTQLQKANDPGFTAVLTSKSEVEAHADSAVIKYRADEQKAIGQASGKAQADEKQGLFAFIGQRGKAEATIKARQMTAKEKDEARRKEVAENIEKIYNSTKPTVEGKLASLETEVTEAFDKGIETAVQNMKTDVEARIDSFKDDRYSGIIGAARWIDDIFGPVPKEIDVILQDGRKKFSQALDALVVRIAALVETRLSEAKSEIAKGQQRISDYVKKLPKDLQDVGKAAQKEMAGRFDALTQSVDDKKNDLAQKLATRYKEATEKADSALKEIKDKNKSLLRRMIEKLAEIVEILRKFKDRVMSLLKKGAATIKLIIADPIGFLGNLLGAIKQGLSQFVGRIWEHLKSGFMAWLFGSLADAGVTIPKDFSLGSILKLVLEVLGLTYARIRAKAVKLIGERNVGILEKAWEIMHALLTGGPAALWEKIKEFMGDLKTMIISAIQEWVVTTIIKAAITKVASMFNPVGAILQAILAIYNTVMFFIERINQIMALVEAIINSVHKIATGDIGGAANWIEQALARAIPVIIGFLARLLGLSGLADKIKGIIQKIQSTVDKAIDKLIEKVVGGIKKVFGGGKDKAEDSATNVTDKARIAVTKELQSNHTKPQSENIVKQIFTRLQPQGLKRLELMSGEQKGEYEIFAEASPRKKVARLIPKRRKVRATITLGLSKEELSKDAPVLEGVTTKLGIYSLYDKSGEKLKSEAIAAPINPVPGKSKSGGVLLPPKVGSNEVKLYTWNTGDLDPRVQSNATHAERQFVEWFRKQPETWQNRIETIDIDINLSPCTFCTVDLVEIATYAPSLKKGTITYKNLYTNGPLATTPASLGQLRSVWTVRSESEKKEEELVATP